MAVSFSIQVIRSNQKRTEPITAIDVKTEERFDSIRSSSKCLLTKSRPRAAAAAAARTNVAIGAFYFARERPRFFYALNEVKGGGNALAEIEINRDPVN